MPETSKLIHHSVQGDWYESLDGRFGVLNSAEFEFRIPLVPRALRIYDLQITDLKAEKPVVFRYRVYGNTLSDAFGYVERNFDSILAEYF